MTHRSGIELQVQAIGGRGNELPRFSFRISLQRRTCMGTLAMTRVQEVLVLSHRRAGCRSERRMRVCLPTSRLCGTVSSS